MALPDYAKIGNATEITFKSSGGSAAITMTSVANGAARQSVKCDFGALRPRRYWLKAQVEMAATPTAGTTIGLYMGWSNSATAGTDNPTELSGTDAAYTGQSSNLSASLPQLAFLGDAVLSALATATVQHIDVGIVEAPMRYGSLVVMNNSGAAFHSSATNISFRFIPILDSVEDTA